MQYPFVEVTDEDILSRIKEIYEQEHDDCFMFGRAYIRLSFKYNKFEIFYREGCSNLIFIKHGLRVDLYVRNEDAIYVDCVPYEILRRDGSKTI